MHVTPQQFIRGVIGVPFIPRGRGYSGVDCYGLVYLAHRDVLGIELPTYVEDYGSTRPSLELAELITTSRKETWWVVENEPARFGDVVLLRCGGLPVHCGVAIGDGARMLHVEQGISTCLESYGSPLWQRRVEGFWRHALRA